MEENPFIEDVNGGESLRRLNDGEYRNANDGESSTCTDSHGDRSSTGDSNGIQEVCKVVNPNPLGDADGMNPLLDI
jgi:hypothetical protein